MQGDSKYNRDKYGPESESLSGTKAIAIKHINLTIGVAIITNAIKFVQMD